MKTVQELYNEIMGNEALKAQCVEAATAGKLEALLKEQGCDATLEEVAAFLKAKAEEDAPLSLDELENSAGGDCGSDPDTTKKAPSTASAFGAGCPGFVVRSTVITFESRDRFKDSESEGRGCDQYT